MTEGPDVNKDYDILEIVHTHGGVGALAPHQISGDEYEGRCPIHAKVTTDTPLEEAPACTIKVNAAKNVWNCTSGSGGDLIGLLMACHSWSYSEVMDLYGDVPHNPDFLYRAGEIAKSEKGICVAPTRRGADRLAELGICATSITKWNDKFGRAFKDRAVIMLPDNSNPGREFMGSLAGHISKTAVNLRMVHIPDLDPGEGVETWLSNGGTKDLLTELIGATELWQTEPAEAVDIKTKEPVDAENSWKPELLRKANGSLESGAIENVCLMLAHHDSWKGRFRYNTFSHDVEYNGSPIADNDDTMICRWMERMGMKLKPPAMRAALTAVAMADQYNPLQDYLHSLEWDGEPRIDTWLSKYLGCDTTPYTEMIARKFLIGSVARGLKPGCKMDYLLILEGDQGIKKSSAIEALFSPPFFTDELGDLGSKDAALQVQGVWCVEMAELSSLSRSAANRAKEWITRRRDRFRPPYGRSIIEAPRACVLMGTVNPEGGYLKDSTGGRRFWPVQCHKITVAGIRANRDQLWAEAKTAFDNNESWWIDHAEEQALASEQQEMRYEGDPWHDKIQDWLGLNTDCSVAEIMDGCLELEPAQQTQPAQTRIAKILQSCGWRKYRKSVNKQRSWRYSHS